MHAFSLHSNIFLSLGFVSTNMTMPKNWKWLASVAVMFQFITETVESMLVENMSFRCIINRFLQTEIKIRIKIKTEIIIID